MNLLGTKLCCDECGAQVVVIKGGDGELACHGRPMQVIAGAMRSGSPERPARSQEPGDEDVEYY